MCSSFASNDGAQSQGNGSSEAGDFLLGELQVGLTMASVLRQRFGAVFRRSMLPSMSQHPVHAPYLVAQRFMGGHGDDAGEPRSNFSLMFI